MVSHLEVNGNLGLLLGAIVELLEVLHKLNALVVGAPHKGLIGHGEVEALKGLLGEDTPETRMASSVDKCI